MELKISIFDIIEQIDPAEIEVEEEIEPNIDRPETI